MSTYYDSVYDLGLDDDSACGADFWTLDDELPAAPPWKCTRLVGPHVAHCDTDDQCAVEGENAEDRKRL